MDAHCSAHFKGDFTSWRNGTEQDNSAIFAAVTVENWIEIEILWPFEEKGC